MLLKMIYFFRKATKKEILNCHDTVLWELLEKVQDEKDLETLREISSR
jgi:hypothetical protein